MPQAVTIAVEWEQARRQEQARSRAMLRRLAEEVRSQPGEAISTPVELIVCVEERELDRCRSFVLLALGRDAGLFEIRVLPAVGPEYYVLKNLAAAHATGDVVVFLDSDVVPEPRWLGNLLAPFDDPDVSVVGGTTYIESTSTYGRTFALIWMFPPRTRTDKVGPASRFWANNLAFRREVAERFPFPSMPEISRGSCQLLEGSLARHGVRVVTADGARAGHPAPAGPGQFFARSFSRGRDRLLLARPGQDRTWRGTRDRLRSEEARSVRRVVSLRGEVGLSLAALPLAVAIATSFTLCCALGELLTMANRSFMVRHFRI